MKYAYCLVLSLLVLSLCQAREISEVYFDGTDEVIELYSPIPRSWTLTVLWASSQPIIISWQLSWYVTIGDAWGVYPLTFANRWLSLSDTASWSITLSENTTILDIFSPWTTSALYNDKKQSLIKNGWSYTWSIGWSCTAPIICSLGLAKVFMIWSTQSWNIQTWVNLSWNTSQTWSDIQSWNNIWINTWTDATITSSWDLNTWNQKIRIIEIAPWWSNCVWEYIILQALDMVSWSISIWWLWIWSSTKSFGVQLSSGDMLVVSSDISRIAQPALAIPSISLNNAWEQISLSYNSILQEMLSYTQAPSWMAKWPQDQNQSPTIQTSCNQPLTWIWACSISIHNDILTFSGEQNCDTVSRSTNQIWCNIAYTGTSRWVVTATSNTCTASIVYDTRTYVQQCAQQPATQVVSSTSPSITAQSSPSCAIVWQQDKAFYAWESFNLKANVSWTCSRYRWNDLLGTWCNPRSLTIYTWWFDMLTLVAWSCTIKQWLSVPYRPIVSTNDYWQITYNQLVKVLKKWWWIYDITTQWLTPYKVSMMTWMLVPEYQESSWLLKIMSVTPYPVWDVETIVIKHMSDFGEQLKAQLFADGKRIHLDWFWSAWQTTIYTWNFALNNEIWCVWIGSWSVLIQQLCRDNPDRWDILHADWSKTTKQKIIQNTSHDTWQNIQEDISYLKDEYTLLSKEYDVQSQDYDKLIEQYHDMEDQKDQCTEKQESQKEKTATKKTVTKKSTIKKATKPKLPSLQAQELRLYKQFVSLIIKELGDEYIAKHQNISILYSLLQKHKESIRTRTTVNINNESIKAYDIQASYMMTLYPNFEQQLFELTH